MKSKVHPKYRTKYRDANWPAYERALVGRGDGRGQRELWTTLIRQEAICGWEALSLMSAKAETAVGEGYLP